MQAGSANPAKTNPLKRAATSLSDELRCGFCEKTFSSPHQLDKHEKTTCRASKRELSELLRKAKHLVSADEPEASKRRRLESETSGVPSSSNRGTLLTTPYPTQIVAITPGRQTNSQLPLVSAPSLHPRTWPPTETDPNQTEASKVQPPPSQLETGRPAAEELPEGTSSGRLTPTASQSKAPAPKLDENGLQRRYNSSRASPNHNPDDALTSVDLYDSRHHRDSVGGPRGEEVNGSHPEPATTTTVPMHEPQTDSDALPYAPFPNLSSFELGDWFYSQGVQKSLRDFKSLVAILTSPDFSLEDIRSTKWTTVFQDLGKNKEELDEKRSAWIDDSGWKTSEVKIEVPIHHRMAQGRGVENHVAGTLYHRNIVSIVEEKIRNTVDSKSFHFDGHELVWKPDGPETTPEFRVLSELYHSDAFLSAEREVRESPPPNIKDCPLPRVVVGLMFWSDATHLSTFSHSKLWPLYMLFANESKHTRTRATSHHVAYFDALSDSFKDYLTRRTGGKVPPNGFMAHLNREVFHAQWILILDEELLKAIIEGIVIQCSDGVWRRFFIRIFTYSADYPEKVLIATIRARGDCPCTSCLVSKKKLDQMGTPEDMAFRQTHTRVDDSARQTSVIDARAKIQGGFAVNGKIVHRLLTNGGVPTINAFSSRLKTTGFNIFSTLVVDLLHEYEVGVFKALFVHLIRILHASSPGAALVHELDRRYRATPTFKQTVRKFSSNASQLTRRAARDYEDLLQCAIPVFDGLLPAPLNSLVLELLFVNARWHALAKLRMQTEASIILLDDATTCLGELFRRFIKETSTIKTVELPKEAQKRERSEKKKDGKGSHREAEIGPSTTAAEDSHSLNLPPSVSSSASEGVTTSPKLRNNLNERPSTAPRGSRGGGRDIGASSRGRGRGRGRGSSTGRGRGARGKGAAANPLVPSQPTFRIISQAPSSSTAAPAAPSIATSAIRNPTSPPMAPLAEEGSATQTQESGMGGPQASGSGGLEDEEGEAPLAESTVEPGSNNTSQASRARRRPKLMNISTIKFHTLGHYPSTIRWFGPTDLYSTEWGEHFHRSPKAWHKATSRRFLRKELSRHERRRARLRRLKQNILANSVSPEAQELKEQRKASKNPDLHHYIGTSKQAPVSLGAFMPNGQFSDDIASAHFIRKLKRHLLPRIVAGMRPDLSGKELSDFIGEHSDNWANIVLKDDRIYTHKIMRIKFATYDARRDEDIIHLETDQSNLMLLNPSYSYGSCAEPFLYCKVIAILHAEVGYIADLGRLSNTNHYHYLPMEFLWVRWYEPVGHAPVSGKVVAEDRPASSWLDEVSLRPIDQQDALGFVDPNDVLRACHIIPKFRTGVLFADGKGRSRLAQDGSDWNVYYVNRFVDRDMFMRYEWGLGVGHKYAHKDSVTANQKILATQKKSSFDRPCEGGGGNKDEGQGPSDVGVTVDVDADVGGGGGLDEEEEDEEDEEDDDDDHRDDEDRSSSDSDSSGHGDVDSEDERIYSMYGDET